MIWKSSEDILHLNITQNGFLHIQNTLMYMHVQPPVTFYCLVFFKYSYIFNRKKKRKNAISPWMDYFPFCCHSIPVLALASEWIFNHLGTAVCGSHQKIRWSDGAKRPAAAALRAEQKLRYCDRLPGAVWRHETVRKLLISALRAPSKYQQPGRQRERHQDEIFYSGGGGHRKKEVWRSCRRGSSLLRNKKTELN